jgi:hypothetical protein
MRAAGCFAIISIVLAGLAYAGDPAETFPTSLHGSRPGKGYWYSAANGGFEKWTGVGIGELGCAQCHGATDADGNPSPDPYPGASCVDCHSSADNSVSQDQCFTCHGRQAMEALRMGLPDVHRDAGMVCWDCHGSEDMHGDGISYSSMLERGAIKADCADCHEAAELPAKHRAYDPHKGSLHCTACHSSTVISCYNCHFESQASAHVKRAMQPIAGFVLLVNRTKDNKVHPASFQSLTFEGNAFVAFGPYTPHATTRQGRKCGECHLNRGKPANEAIEQYNSHGAIDFVTWNTGENKLDWIKGVVPVPNDYRETLRMEFMTFDGDPAAPPGPDAGPWSPIGKDSPDGSQLFFATPMTTDQMEKLGFEPRE